RVGNSRVKIKVLEIRDKSVPILIEGQTEPKELVLQEIERPSVSYDQLMRQRYGLATGKKEKSRVESRLEAIVLDEVMFDALPLPQVLQFLSDESRKRDPEKKGLNFLINPNNLSVAQATAIDPTTGAPVPLPAPEPIDMNSVIVRFNLPLRDVRLKDVLDAVVKVADKPLEYSVEEYGVVFSANSESPGGSIPAQPPFGASMPLEVRTFRVETNMFLAGLENAFGIKLEEITPTRPSTEKGWKSREVQSALRKLLTQLSINMDVPGKSVFYNDLTGIVMVRATREDLEIVRAAIETLGGTGGETAAAGAVP
ncbi:MAG TPA: hypothetical protein VJW76_02260, partial [Verrucomicrobiae bacterium]|nr:hypothetical protein [Verrucomicrobiae bacterium]